LTTEPAESAADLKESGPDTKLKMLETKIVFQPLRTIELHLIFVSRRVKTRQPPPLKILAAQPYPASRQLKLNDSEVYPCKL
jgi:hypothetical protein